MAPADEGMQVTRLDQVGGIPLGVMHDAKYGKPSPSFYRLKMGSFPYADTLFPLGWTRGDAVHVTFVGGNIGEHDATDSLILPSTGRSIPVGLNGAGARAAQPLPGPPRG